MSIPYWHEEELDPELKKELDESLDDLDKCIQEERNRYIKTTTPEEAWGSLGQAKATQKQVGGDHYKSCKIQPIEYIVGNELGWCEGNIVKYTTRHNKKGKGREDILKVIHYAQLLLELEYPEDGK